jgi:hypothetical protein
VKRTPWWRDPGTLLVLGLIVGGLVIIGVVNGWR